MNLDWHGLILHAQGWRCIIPLQRVLSSLEKFWPGLVPEALLEEVDSLRPVFKERCQLGIEKTKGRPSFNHPLFWISMPGFSRRFEVIFKDTFPSPEYMRKRYGPAPAGFWSILYFQRVLHAFQLMKK